MTRGRVELGLIVAAHLALSLALVDWPTLADGPPAAFVYQLAFRLALPVVAAGFLWAGRPWAWWALVGLFAVRALGEVAAGVVGGGDKPGVVLAVGYAVLAAWAGLSGGVRRLGWSRP